MRGFEPGTSEVATHHANHWAMMTWCFEQDQGATKKEKKLEWRNSNIMTHGVSTVLFGIAMPDTGPSNQT